MQRRAQPGQVIVTKKIVESVIREYNYDNDQNAPE